MRIVLLVTDLEPGGTPLRLYRLAQGLRQRGIDVALGCLAPPGPVGQRAEAAGVCTFACGARGLTSLGAVARLARILADLRPDLIHATLTHANLAARLAGDWLRVPVVTSTATIEVERRWHVWAERTSAHLDQGHLVNSNTLARHVCEQFWLDPQRVHVVPPLVQYPRLAQRDAARRALGLGSDVRVVAWAGRFDPVKRLELAIDALALLPGEVRLVLAGDGPQRGRIEQYAAASAVGDRVVFAGWLEEPGTLMSAADVLVFPSLTEGLPNVVLQAMLAGVPVVGSDIPALRELAGDGEPRLWLVADGGREYAAALGRLLDDDRLRARLAARARIWAQETLDNQRAIDAHLAVYRGVLEGR